MIYSSNTILGELDAGISCVTSRFDELESSVRELENRFIELGNAFRKFSTNKKEVDYFDSLINYIENNGLKK